MLNLVDWRERHERDWLNKPPSEGETLKEGRPVWSLTDPLRTVLITALLLAGLLVATRAFMVIFTATIEASSRALPIGSLTVPRRVAFHALDRERTRRREALANYDHHIAIAEGHPSLQTAWRDLKQREIEAVEQLERHLDDIRRLDPSTLTASRGRD